jgi:excinuclease ABC subunit C
MAEAAQKQDYELAAVYRDRLRALTYIQGSQTVHAEGLGDADVLALACKGGAMSIQAFFIRGGSLWTASWPIANCSKKRCRCAPNARW